MIDILLLNLVGLSLLLGQLGRISLGNGIQFYALELLVLVHVLILLFRNRLSLTDSIRQCHTELVSASRKHMRISIVIIFWFIFVLFIYLITSLGKDFSDNLKAGMYIARIGLFAIYFYLLTLMNIQKQLMAKILWIISIVIPAVCLLQYLLVPDLRFLAQFGWDPHMYRAVGLFLDPPIVGVILGVLLFVALRQAHLDKTPHFVSAFNNYLPVFLNFFAIIFLFSRSTYLAIAFVIFVYLVFQKKYLVGVLWVVVLSASVYFAPKTIPAYYNLESAKIERVSTVLSRRVELENGFRAWIAHPIFGIGYNRVAEYKQSLPRVYGTEVESNHSSSAFHSFWLTQLATTGLIGFVLLLSVYLLVMKRSLFWALALTIPALVGLLDNVVFHPFVLILFIYIYFSKTLDVKSLREYH